jgi:thymidylate synthase ThyX
MNESRRVYLLNYQSLSPETIAVTFAKTSRSPETFREIAAGLTDEKSADFHEKWVVGYGHASVAEHAVLHIAVENISRLAVEPLESSRLASYTEKSTRYQKWDKDQYHIPTEIKEDASLLKLYTSTSNMLFQTYANFLPKVRKQIAKTDPQRPEETEEEWDRRIRSKYADVCRFLLPAASLANVGVTINARNLEHSIQKMLSHPLAEVRILGTEIKSVATEHVPTLVKYANETPYLKKSRMNFLSRSSEFDSSTSPPTSDWCRLTSYPNQYEDKILAACLFRFGSQPYETYQQVVENMKFEQKAQLGGMLFENLQKYDIPLRELEHANFTYELLLDQGAYFELKRHRMMTQTPQMLTCNEGFAVPKIIAAAGLEKEYHSVMQSAASAYKSLAQVNPWAAAYIVPNAYNRRVLLTLNLRAFDHLLALRSAPNAHFSIRRMAQRMAEEIRQHSPLFGALLRVSPSETWQSIEEGYFSKTR